MAQVVGGKATPLLTFLSAKTETSKKLCYSVPLSTNVTT